MGRTRNSQDDWPDESDGSRTGPKPGRPGRIYALPGGGLAMLILLLAGLVWVAHDRPNHSTSKSNPGRFAATRPRRRPWPSPRRPGPGYGPL